MNRRQALALLGTGAGAAGFALLPRTAARAATTATTATTCAVEAPTVTEGPYWVDEMLNRSDVRSDSDGTNTQAGVLLSLTITVQDLASCAAVEGAQVDIWHANAQGQYSDENVAQNGNTSGHQWLRGYQVTGANGVVTFTTIFPGWYSGRTDHVHVRVRFGGVSYKVTQLFFDETTASAVYATSAYKRSGSRTTTNSNDGIYGQEQSAGNVLLVPLTGSTGSGYAGAITVALDAPSGTTTPTTSRYVPLAPARVLDTRTSSRLGAKGTRTLDLSAALPSTATAVVLNLTAVTPTADTYVTAYPAGTATPTASSVNAAKGAIVPNLCVVELGTGRAVTLYNAAGSVDVLADLAGYFDSASGSAFAPQSPTRVLDTRLSGGAVAAGESRVLDLSSAVPAGATAALLTLTGTGPTAATYVTAYPGGTTRPTASNLNLPRGATQANLVAVQLPTDRTVALYNANGATHLVADLAGWYTSTGDVFVPLAPTRVLDTRSSGGAVGAGATRTVALASSLPTNATAVVLNVTATGGSTQTYVAAYPSGTANPGTSNLNPPKGSTVAALVTVEVGSDRGVTLYNAAGSVHLIADLAGYYVPSS